MLEQRFTRTAPNIVWCSEITYIYAGNRFYYLCVIIDLFSRKVVSYKISARADANLVRIQPMRSASQKVLCFILTEVVNTAFSFRSLLDKYNIIQSFSKKGHPYYNAVVESFFKYLKLEETNHKSYQSFKELELSIFSYIEGYYNSKRPHGSLGYLTPNQFEKKCITL